MAKNKPRLQILTILFGAIPLMKLHISLLLVTCSSIFLHFLCHLDDCPELCVNSGIARRKNAANQTRRQHGLHGQGGLRLRRLPRDMFVGYQCFSCLMGVGSMPFMNNWPERGLISIILGDSEPAAVTGRKLTYRNFLQSIS